MTYALRAGLSFCAVEDRLLFLDLPADRYFCLSSRADRAFTHLYRGDALEPADRDALRGLALAGLLIDGGTPSIAPCAALPAAASLLDSDAGQAGAFDRVAALCQLSYARIELGALGFARAIARLRRRKRRLRPRAGHERVAAIATAFEDAAAIVSTRDRCLPRAIAIAHRLLRIGAAPDLVVAVQLAPFQAHAWVQWKGLLVNERLEIARQFTPILVV